MDFLKKNKKLIVGISLLVFTPFIFYIFSEFVRNASIDKNIAESEVRIALSEKNIKESEIEYLKKDYDQKISWNDEYIKNLESEVKILKSKLEKRQVFSEDDAYKRLLASKYYSDWVASMNKYESPNKPIVYHIGITDRCNYGYEFEFRENTGVVNAFHASYCVSGETLEIKSLGEILKEDEVEK